MEFLDEFTDFILMDMGFPGFFTFDLDGLAIGQSEIFRNFFQMIDTVFNQFIRFAAARIPI